MQLAATVTETDVRGLRKLKDACGARFAGGAVLYDGGSTVRFAEDLLAVPVKALWSGK